MSKTHFFQRYSSRENTVTNNTLHLLERIYSYSPIRVSELLSGLTGEPIKIGIEFEQQGRAKGSVPDGAIYQESFRILIEAKVDAETKVDAGTYVDQLLRHANTFSSERQKILLLLTKQPLLKEEQRIHQRISGEYPGVIFKNITYEDICSSITGLFRDYEFEMCSLVNDYIAYCNDTELYDQSRFLLRIVPCGHSLGINKKYGIYFQPSSRGYTNHSFVGIYADKIVQSIWKIDSVFDVEFDGTELRKSLVQGRDTKDYDENLINIISEAKTECGYQIESGHRFFCGTSIDTAYRKSSPGGIQGARFINLKDVIADFSESAADVAAKLRDKEWG